MARPISNKGNKNNIKRKSNVLKMNNGMLSFNHVSISLSTDPGNSKYCAKLKHAKLKRKKILGNRKYIPFSLIAEVVMNCNVIGLESVDSLAKKFRGKFNLKLSLLTNGAKYIQAPEISKKLDQWEMNISKICKPDPVIAIENFVDDEGPPDGFHYVRENIYTLAIKLDPDFLVGCDCAPRCSYNCKCPANSGGKFAYDRTKKILLSPGSPVYECNEKCKCSSDCPNRVIQKGLTSSVCIFRTSNGRGWGLKTREFIPKNKFVVEYVGEVITSEEAERRGKVYDRMQQTYLFDLDFHDKDAIFTVDAYVYGNVSHFINHSCDPNLQVYSVWVDSIDCSLPRLGLFAKRDIGHGEELTFDYMMSNSHNLIPPKKTGNQFCACGAANCRKYLF